MSFMSVLTIIAVLCIAFALVWRFNDTLLGIFPLLICSIGLILYVLSFFRIMSFIDWILLAGGCVAAFRIIAWTFSKGKASLQAELKRQFCDPHLWMCFGILLIMCFLLRGEQILEWDGYNFWGPDTKSLFYRDGLAEKYSNAAPRFGDYPPMTQLILWLGPHLAGAYNEQYIFFMYYILGAILLFSVADKFRMQAGAGKYVVAILSCAGAIILPGMVCTAWFRALCVDPIMAMLFGLTLAQIVCRVGVNPKLQKAKILVYIMSVCLIKSIGILWSILALLFYVLWTYKEQKQFKFILCCTTGIALCYGSWSGFCRIMERSTYLVDSFSTVAAERILEIKNGVFLTSKNNWGYITSYARAFLLTPMHREQTFAVDLTPVVFFVLLFAAILILWKCGFIPKKKIGRLIGFMILTIGIIYAVLMIGQLTMFYTEEQYLDPVRAVTLMTRYCAPANMGLLILACAFASGTAVEPQERPSVPNKASITSFVLTGALVFSCGAYTEMWRRFIYDPLDESRIEKREQFCQTYSDFLADIKAVPLHEEGSRVLLCVYKMEVNPIIINEASPVSFLSISFTGDDQQDMSAISEALAEGHEKYLYVANSEESFANMLSSFTSDSSKFALNTLYEIRFDDQLILTPVHNS